MRNVMLPFLDASKKREQYVKPPQRTPSDDGTPLLAPVEIPKGSLTHAFFMVHLRNPIFKFMWNAACNNIEVGKERLPKGVMVISTASLGGIRKRRLMCECNMKNEFAPRI